MQGLLSIATHTLSVFSIGLLVLSAVLVYALVTEGGFSIKVIGLVGKYARHISFCLALGGMLGSLFYSEIIGFAPCILCVIQRFFLYPQVFLLGVAISYKRFKISLILIILSIGGGLVALYHSYSDIFGSSLIPCTAEGGSCSKVYFLEWGFVTLAFMSFTTFIAMIMLEFAHRKFLRLSHEEINY